MCVVFDAIAFFLLPPLNCAMLPKCFQCFLLPWLDGWAGALLVLCALFSFFTKIGLCFEVGMLCSYYFLVEPISVFLLQSSHHFIYCSNCSNTVDDGPRKLAAQSELFNIRHEHVQNRVINN